MKISSIVVFIITVISLTIASSINAAPKDERKISQSIRSVLSIIDAKSITRANAQAKNIYKLSNYRLHVEDNGRIHIYIYMTSIGEAELVQLRKYEVKIEIINEDLAIVQGWTPFDRIRDIATLPFVQQI